MTATLLFLQLLLHGIGDYYTQSHWMATNKTTNSRAAAAHALVYSLPFLLIGSFWAVIVIMVTHFFIDRYRLAIRINYLKNVLFDPRFWKHGWPTGKYWTCAADACTCKSDWCEWDREFHWENCKDTGWPKGVPAFVTFWLGIIVDNILHIAINAAALSWL